VAAAAGPVTLSATTTSPALPPICGALAQVCRLGRCSKSSAIWGKPAIMPMPSRRQPATQSGSWIDTSVVSRSNRLPSWRSAHQEPYQIPRDAPPWRCGKTPYGACRARQRQHDYASRGEIGVGRYSALCASAVTSRRNAGPTLSCLSRSDKRPVPGVRQNPPAGSDCPPARRSSRRMIAASGRPDC
jgi:hypothetical protein